MRKRVADRRPAAAAGRTTTRHRIDAAATLRRGHAVGAVVAALLLPGSTYADSLAGRVLDPQGGVVPQAELLLYERTGGGQVREGNAGPDGQYVFDEIPGGEYVLEGRASGDSLSGSAVVAVAGDQTLDLELAVSGISAEVVVTASSTPLAVQEVAKVVDVIDSEEIALRNELSITEALRTLPGIRVQTLRGPGSYTTIQTRGLRGHDTALLIDGMRFRDAASPQGDATAFYESLTTVDTERIEVLRGSGSSLYGSSAMAGVINVTSRTGAGAPEGDLLIEGGGLGLVRSVPSIRGGLANDRFTYSGAMAYINMTEGVRGENPYKSVSPQGTVRYRFTPGLSATGRFWYTRDDLRLTESPAFPAEVLDNFPATGVVPARALPTDQLALFEQGQAFTAGSATFVPSQNDPDANRESSFLNGSATLQHTVAAGATYRVSYQGVDTNRAFLDGPLGGGPFEPATSNRSNYDGRIDTLQARLDTAFGTSNTFSAGYELEREEYFSASSTNDASVRIGSASHSLYAQDQLHFLDGRLQATLGTRLQAFDLQDPLFVGGSHPYAGVVFDAPTAYTGDVSVAYFVPTSGTKVRMHVGNSYRAPSAFERFGGSFSSFSGSFSYWGDPGLNPERSVAFDAGVDQWWFDSKMQLSTTFFYTDLLETIIFDFANFPAATDPFGRFGGYRNTGGGQARGVEMSVQAAPSTATNLRIAYTYTDSRSNTPTIGDDFFGVPGLSEHMFTLTATQWIADRVNVAFDLFAASDYFLSPYGANSRRMLFHGPMKADLVLRYDLPTGDGLRMDVYGKVENLFDQYAYEDGFLGPGRWAIAGLRFRY
jgi:iron complex outermembrane receptor protein